MVIRLCACVPVCLLALCACDACLLMCVLVCVRLSVCAPVCVCEFASLCLSVSKYRCWPGRLCVCVCACALANKLMRDSCVCLSVVLCVLFVRAYKWVGRCAGSFV